MVRILKRLALALFLLSGIGIVFVRLAPSDPAKWHKPLDFTQNADFASGVERVVNATPDILHRLNQIALDFPRTKLLAGSVEEGRITYVTRTKIIGFPDYTTVELQNDQLLIFARLRFGGSDFGVNRDRIDQWLRALEVGG